MCFKSTSRVTARPTAEKATTGRAPPCCCSSTRSWQLSARKVPKVYSFQLVGAEVAYEQGGTGGFYCEFAREGAGGNRAEERRAVSERGGAPDDCQLGSGAGGVEPVGIRDDHL